MYRFSHRDVYIINVNIPPFTTVDVYMKIHRDSAAKAFADAIVCVCDFRCACVLCLMKQRKRTFVRFTYKNMLLHMDHRDIKHIPLFAFALG